MGNIAEHLLDLLCEHASDTQLVEVMRERGICDSQQAMLLADAKMSHKRMITGIMALIDISGLLPKAGKRQFTEDSNLNASLKVLYDACQL
jgi:hypothetical protein